MDDAHKPCGCEGGCPLAGRLPGGRPSEEVLPVLPLLESALAVTGRPGVVMAQTGRYAPVSVPGGALIVPDGRIAMRADAARLRVGIVVRGRGERMLQLAADGGEVVHSVRALSATDTLVLDGLARPERERGPVPEAGSQPARGAGPRPLPAAPWEEADHLAQLDAVIADGGVARRRRMAADYRGEAVSVDAAVLPAVLDHLRATELPVAMAAFAPGIAQLADGRVRLVTGFVEGSVGVVIGTCTVDLDLASVREAIVVTSHGPLGPTSALEVYGPDGDVLLMLTQLGLVDPPVHAAWQDLTASLPVAG